MRALVCLSALLTLGAAARAEEPGVLAGSVRTREGAALPQVVLVIEGPTGTQHIVTGPDGRYRVAGLAPGAYALRPEVPGFVVTPAARADVGPGETRLDVILAPAPVREHVVVSATRGDALSSSLGVSVTVLGSEEIAERQASSFLSLLQDLPGVAVARAGGIGLQGSAFVRGGASNAARVLVDGVPLNAPGGLVDLGSQLPLELQQVELLRGAASSLYGTDALAGVVQLVTRRAAPDEPLGLRAEAEAGDFAFRRLLGGTSGRAGRFDWSVGLTRLTTDNQEQNSRFEETGGAASLGVSLSERTSLRVVARGTSSTVGTPGQTAFGRADLDASFENDGLVLGAELRHARERVSHALRLGWAASDQLSLDPLDSGTYTPRAGDAVGSFPISDFPNPDGYQNDARRLTGSYQLEAQLGERHLVTAGADLERETGALGARPDDLIRPERTNLGLYAQDRWLVGERLFLTLGGRLERNASFGWSAVPRVALAARLAPGTTLKASAGAGIKEPSFLESYGVSFYAKGNPDLRPERSRTYDLGIDQRLFGDRLRLEVTAYQHEYLDQIAYQLVDPATFEGSYSNLCETRARGVELSVEAAPSPHLQLSARYTFLDGEILVSNGSFDPVYAVGQGLLRRPRHQAALSARGGFDRVSGGLNLVLVGRRADSDFAGLGLSGNDGYARLDARVRVELGRGFEAFVLGENLLDRSYQEVLGYPALGRAVRVGLRFRSAGRS